MLVYYLEPNQGVETVPFGFDDRIVNILSIQSAFLEKRFKMNRGKAFCDGPM